jgi:hypothetical protein
MDKALVAAERAAAENLTSRQRARWRGLCFCELCKKNEAETDMRCNHVTLISHEDGSQALERGRKRRPGACPSHVHHS